MKALNILVVAIFVPTLLCHSQDAKPSDTPAPTASVAVPNGYVIGAADVLAVTVWKEPTLSGSLLVRPDGMVSLPLVGDVLATGLTPLQLGDDLTNKLKKYIQDPKVSVVVVAVNSQRIYLLGEVGKPGPLTMTPGMTVLQAVSTAGGPSQYANTKKMYILRNDGGKEQRIPVHYKEALKGDSSQNLVLKSGDTIVIP